MLKPFFKSLISACLILLIFPVSTLAFPDFSYMTKGGVSLEQGDIRLGRVQLHPGLAFESSYESNILDEADQTFATTVEEPTDDFIFAVKPSMRVELERAKGEVFGFYADYEGKDENFLHEGDTLDFFNHLISGGINLGGPGGRGDVTIGGSWQKSAGGTSRDLNSNVGNRQATTTTVGFVELLYSISENFKLQLKGDATDQKFQGNRVENSDEYNLGGSLYWQATKPAAFGVKYNHRIRSYDFQIPTLVNDDSVSDQAFLAMKWTPTSLITSEIAVGFDTKRFENFSGENIQDFVYQLDVTYTPFKRTRVSLHAGREIPDSSFAGIQSLILSTFRLGLSQKLGKKFTLLADLSHENLDYRRSSVDGASGGTVRTRVDNTVSGSTALVYQIQKWLDAKARYQYEENISNFHSSNFLNHIGILEIAAKY